MTVRTFAWRGPVPEGCELRTRTVYPLLIVNGEPVLDNATGKFLREQLPIMDLTPVPVDTADTAPIYPILSDEKIAEMVVRSLIRDGEIPTPDNGPNPGSGNGGAKVPATNGPRPITPISGAANPLPKILRP